MTRDMTNSILNARQRGDDFFHHPSANILFEIAAHVLETEHGNRRLVGQGERRSLGGQRPGGVRIKLDLPTRIGSAMFFRFCSPRSSQAMSILPRICR